MRSNSLSRPARGRNRQITTYALRRSPPLGGASSPNVLRTPSGLEIYYRHGAPGGAHRLAFLVLYPDLPHLAPATGVNGRPRGGQDAPRALGPEVARVYLGPESGFARGAVQEGAYAGHRLGEDDAHAPVQVAEGLQVPLVYRHRGHHALRIQLHELDAQVPGHVVLAQQRLQLVTAQAQLLLGHASTTHAPCVYPNPGSLATPSLPSGCQAERRKAL